MLGTLVAAVALSGAAGCADAVANSASVWVSVSPATVTAGFQTQVTASCGENANSATVSSTAFGSHTLQPVGGVLATTVTVVPNTASGTYGVRLACPTGSQATTTLTVIGRGGGQKASVPGPDTGGGFLAGNPDQATLDQGAPDASGQEVTEVAAEGAARAPLVWLGVGLSCLAAAAVVAVRARQRAPVRSSRRSARRDQGTAG